MTPAQQLRHLYWRAGFGPTAAQLGTAPTPTVQAAYSDMVQASQNPKPIRLFKREEWEGYDPKGPKDPEMRDRYRQLVGSANYDWLTRMATSDAQLREKLTFFWHDHFAVRTPLFPLQEQHHNVLRKHALGSYCELLFAVAKDPGMLQFLNNQQNRKLSPNENFARELMELFTLGRGNYTEQDVKEAARAFTGWGFDREGQFVFRTFQHDTGSKTFRGKTGNFGGEDILNQILDDRQTALYITRKLCRYFVSEAVPEDRVQALAKSFYESDYAIEPLLCTLLLDESFYTSTVVGQRIKSPVELLAGLMRTFGIQFQDIGPAVFLEKVMGQILFFPPSVNGWPTGREWIDTSSMVLRMKLGEVLLLSSALDIQAKDDGDDQTKGQDEIQAMTQALAGDAQGVERLRRRLREVKTTSSFPAFAQQFDGLKGEELLNTLAENLLQVPLTNAARSVISQKAKQLPTGGGAHTEAFAYTLQLISLPEYQLC